MGRWVQRPIPVGEGMEGDVVRIERLAFEGDGVGHLEDGKVVFIREPAPATW